MYCWRNSRLEAEKEKTAWPGLQRRDNDSQTYSKQSSQNAASNIAVDNQSFTRDQQSVHLNLRDYPELGRKMSRRKNDPENDPQVYVNNNEVVIINQKGDLNIKVKKYVKNPRKANVIRINIQQALENQKSMKNTLAEKKIKCCDRVVDAKCNKIYLGKAKRPSKLKKIIISEKQQKRKPFYRNNKVKSKVYDTSEIDIGQLKIVADPELDFNYKRNLSTLNFYGNEHRGSAKSSLVEDILENRTDVTQRLENLLIVSKEEDDESEVLDYLRHDIANLQIDKLSNQGAQIHLDEVNRTLSLQCEKTKTQNPTIQDIDGNEIEFQYSRKFREYCTNLTSAALNDSLVTFLTELFRLQKKLYDRDNVKGRYRRRYYTGFKEVEKHVNLKKIRFVIIVPDIEKIEMEGGLDDTVNKLIGACIKQDIPIGFGLSRRKLGYLTHKKGCVSCIGISNFSGTEEKFEKVLRNLVEAKNDFRKQKGELSKVVNLKKLIVEEDLLLSERINMILKILASST